LKNSQGKPQAVVGETVPDQNHLWKAIQAPVCPEEIVVQGLAAVGHEEKGLV